ncbi:HAMP domain-containing methyl-accepting chemotaxis protein [Azospira restricta]|uniref:Methyl-accepting chemotaxis protein n=1 Tax=Azospira restricta TaxID=404405 RepID=A0A974SLQ8_9RHOO|nr:methyl-accepting chemotaxis protein [Azospira restricta]QRJ62426.1 methyl-accepting chemotaxis protein [Azospira restricta]
MNILRNLTVRVQLIATFILVTVGFIVGVGIGDRVSARMHDDAVGIYENALIPTSAVGDIMRNIHDSRAQLLLSLQHDPAGEWAKMHDHPVDKHLGAYADAVDDARDAHASYLKRPALPDNERQLLGAIGGGLDAYAAAGNEVVAAFRAGDYRQANAVILKKINPAMGALEKKVRELETVLIKRSKQENEDSGALRTRLALLMWAGTGLGVALVWGMYFFLARNISRPLARVRDVVTRVAEGDLTTAIEVRAGGNEFDAVLRAIARMQDSLREMTGEIQRAAGVVSSNAQLLSRRIDESAQHSESQHGQILEVTAALQQMSRAIEEVSGGAHGVDEATRRARDLAESGAVSMEGNLTTVNKIVQTVRDSSGAIQDLCDTARRIHELAGIIQDIAGQTNLLALNAAIEAARAGEQGRGFAVVADEVRKLAERTAKSSISIGEMLDSVSHRSDQAMVAMRQVMTDVEEGAAQTREIGDTLRRILEAANEMSRLTRDIASATTQQTQASSQTVASMNGITELTDRNNVAIQEVAVTASEMSEIAGRLQGLVGRFRFAA